LLVGGEKKIVGKESCWFYSPRVELEMEGCVEGLRKRAGLGKRHEPGGNGTESEMPVSEWLAMVEETVLASFSKLALPSALRDAG
jgi:hypothetical protein